VLTIFSGVDHITLQKNIQTLIELSNPLVYKLPAAAAANLTDDEFLMREVYFGAQHMKAVLWSWLLLLGFDTIRIRRMLKGIQVLFTFFIFFFHFYKLYHSKGG
jgi:hypothetical protein